MVPSPGLAELFLNINSSRCSGMKVVMATTCSELAQEMPSSWQKDEKKGSAGGSAKEHRVFGRLSIKKKGPEW